MALGTLGDPAALVSSSGDAVAIIWRIEFGVKILVPHPLTTFQNIAALLVNSFVKDEGCL